MRCRIGVMVEWWWREITILIIIMIVMMKLAKRLGLVGAEGGVARSIMVGWVRDRLGAG